jgi:hypothetical protein
MRPVDENSCRLLVYYVLYKNVFSVRRLKKITLGQHKRDKNNRMIQLTDVFCVLLRYKWASNF